MNCSSRHKVLGRTGAERKRAQGPIDLLHEAWISLRERGNVLTGGCAARHRAGSGAPHRRAGGSTRRPVGGGGGSRSVLMQVMIEEVRRTCRWCRWCRWGRWCGWWRRCRPPHLFELQVRAALRADDLPHVPQHIHLSGQGAARGERPRDVCAPASGGRRAGGRGGRPAAGRTRTSKLSSGGSRSRVMSTS